ncbi:MAG: hypothetical protein A2Y79_11655 [Deltaproteobacteria bacterium RBG_13_43_22]|nr:MAG: hypothetical protein A2Y79_11655 [Deltaproteobacteria bacterium RBG_13_43_22]
MRGDFVIIRSYGGLPLIRRIWDEDEKGVYITNDEQLEYLLSGKDALQPIGFPREDVFKYDPKFASTMENLYKNGEWDWNKLERLR